MADWKRRSVLTTGTTLLAGGLLASTGAAETTDESGAPLEETPGWTSRAGNAGNTRFVPSAGGLEEPEAVAWRYDEYGAAAVADGTVYLRTDEAVHALDAADGRARWVCDDVRATQTPAVADGTVYVTGDRLTAIEGDTGDVRWTAAFDAGASSSSPLVAFETVYVTVDGTLHAFDAADGTRRWSRESVAVTYKPPGDGDPLQTNYAFNAHRNSVAATNGTIWALLDDRASGAVVGMDAVAELDPETGETRWSAPLDSGCYAGGLSATEDALFVESLTEEGVMVFDRATSETGALISDALTVAAADGRTVTRGRYRFGMHDSRSSWKTNGTHRYGRPTIVGETVVVAHSVNGEGTPDEIVGFDLESGTERWRFAFDEACWNDGFDVDCVVADGTVYVTRNGSLAALR